jgi:cobalt-zinc-cadmium efflux system outer membrane protein
VIPAISTTPEEYAPRRRARGARCTVAAALVFFATSLGLTGAQALAQTTVGATAPADTLTLDRVVDEVLRHNDSVSAARLMEEAARHRTSSAGAWEDPMLMVGVENVPTSFDFKQDMMTMTMVGVSQEIPLAGEKGLQAKAAGKEADAARERRRFTEADLAASAKIAYYELYYRTRIVSELERQREILEQVVESATAKLRANQAGQDEVLSSQAEVWRVESMILSAGQKADAARYALNELRGAEAGSPVAIAAPPGDFDVPGSPDAWLDIADRQYPPLQELAHRSESYAYSAKAARRMRWPMLTLSGSYGFRSDTAMEPRDDMISLNAAVSLPIFKGRRQNDMALSMDAMESGVSAEAAQMRREVRSEILTLHDRASRLQKSLDLYRNRIIPTADDAYESALSGYINNRTSYASLLSYAQAEIRDRIAQHEIANELAMTLAQAGRYTWVPEERTETQ